MRLLTLALLSLAASAAAQDVTVACSCASATGNAPTFPADSAPTVTPPHSRSPSGTLPSP